MADFENKNNSDAIVVDLCVQENEVSYSSPAKLALAEARAELAAIEERIDTIATLRTNCDKIDYALAASSGVLCGFMDIFLVGSPTDSVLLNPTDEWFRKVVTSFADRVRKKSKHKRSDPLEMLQLAFKVPYDQTSWGPAAQMVFNLKLNTGNHHFLSLGHNPSLFGLFFSILDQFNNTSHFVAGKELVVLMDAGKGPRLQGNSFVGKLFAGFCNWFGHLMSDVSGSSGSKGRGKGIPSPLWTWMNDVIAVKNKLGIPVSDFEANFNAMALNIYDSYHYDLRFQTAQAIPVLINSLIVRLMYSIRRLLRYYKETKKEDRSFRAAWEKCRPYKSAELSRMLTVAHGAFCLLDISDATIRSFAAGGGVFHPVEFLLRLNIVGVGRFIVSFGGEISRFATAKKDSAFAKREKPIQEEYVAGLEMLAEIYADEDLALLSTKLTSLESAKKAFEDNGEMSRRRGGKSLDTMDGICTFFNGESN